MTFEEWWNDNVDLLLSDRRAIFWASKAWKDATNAERERCAKVARDTVAYTPEYDIGIEISDTILNGKEGKGQ